MSDDTLKDRLAKQGEETLGKIAQDLLENSFVTGALTRAFEARERAVQVQEAAMGALNMPSAADVERLTRRLRSVAQRLEGIEDVLDRLDRRLETTAAADPAAGGDRLAVIEEQLSKLATEVRGLSSALETTPAPVHRAQERLAVDAAPKATPARKPARKPAAKKP
jgi:chromosome segregation ATPase